MSLLGIFYIHLPPPYCVKVVHIWELFWSVFPAFGLNTERYSLSIRIQSECGEKRTRITPNTDTFYVVPYAILLKGYYKRQVHYDVFTKLLPEQFFAFFFFFLSFEAFFFLITLEITKTAAAHSRLELFFSKKDFHECLQEFCTKHL